MGLNDYGRLKGERMQKKSEKEDFRIRWKTIQDICSVMACHSAFQDCMDGNSVELGEHNVVTWFWNSRLPKTISGHWWY
jgi:hypothetical protein